MSVGDRTALFAARRVAADPTSILHSSGACLPLEGRLRAIMRLMAMAWIDSISIPQCKADQTRNPGTLEVRIVFDIDPKPKLMSRILFGQYGLVGVDVKSHKTNTTISYTVIT